MRHARATETTAATAATRWIPRLLWSAALLTALAASARPAPIPPAPSRAVPAIREKKYVLLCRLDYDQEQLAATARLTLTNAGKRPAREVPLLLYRLLTVSEVRIPEGEGLPFTQRVVAFEDEPRRQVNAITVRLAKTRAPGGSTEIVLKYAGFLAGYVETGERYVKDRIDPAFTVLRLDALAYPVVGIPAGRSRRLQGFASFDYQATLDVPDSLQVANGGKLVGRHVADGRATWVYRNVKPCWRMDFAVARYQVLAGDTASVFSFPEDSANAARVREGVLRSMRFFSDWFGPAEEAPRFSVIEVPNGWGSQKDVTCILQSAAAFQDPRRMHEVYHEVSHMWNVQCRDPFPPRIEEGLASYLEDVASERLEGGDRVRRSHEVMVPWLRDLLEKEPRYRNLAMRDYGVKGDTDLSYSVGFLMFEVLHTLVGDRAFAEIIGGFRRRYRDSGATTAEFIAFAKQHSPIGLEAFFVDWYATTRWERLLGEHATLASMVDAYRPPGSKP